MKRAEEQAPVSPFFAKQKYKQVAGTVVKVTSEEKNFVDEIALFLSGGFDVVATSSKMFSQETDCFFQFFKVERKKGDPQH
jgi:hypothetical protein